MSFPIVTPEQVSAFILIFLRVTTILVMIPVFGDRAVPARVKGGLGILVTLILYPLIRIEVPDLFTADLFFLATAMSQEVLIGILIGFACRCLFMAIQAAGELTGLQIGLSMANIFDPLTSVQITIVSEFLYLMGALVFLMVDGHHIFLAALRDSYQYLPPFTLSLKGSLMTMLLRLTADVFRIALQLSAPVLAVAVLINVSLGVIARTVPQINVFIVGFPLQIAVGLIFLGLGIPLFVRLTGQLFLGLQKELRVLFQIVQ
ncbi:MAG TPA: flagellar biosynthetic protein FliR [Syntrophales bacterium]|nr:flagellar biosynthetic protein FliR [Syntrophales bacterium]